MAWSYEFDTETIQGSTNPRLIDDKITTILKALQERMNTDHYFPLDGTQVSDTEAGEHRKITFHEVLDDDPDPGEGKGALYLKNLGEEGSERPELVFQDEDNDVIQITENGLMKGGALAQDTEANFLAGTTAGTYDGQIKCGSDHNAMWRWDATNEVWVKITPLVKHYYGNADGDATDETVTTSHLAKKIDGANSSIALKLIKGESLMIDVTISVHASGATDPEDNRYVDVYVKRVTVGEEKILLTDGSAVAVASDVPNQHARMTINSDGNIVTGTFRFYDATPEADAEYTEHTYEVYAKKSSAPATMYIRGIQTKMTIMRTSAI